MGQIRGSREVHPGAEVVLYCPGMLLFRPVRRGLVPRTKLEEMFRQFQSVDWTSLLLETAAVSAEAHSRFVRRKRRDTNDNEAKRGRAGNGSGSTWGIVCSEAGFGGSLSCSRQSAALKSLGNQSTKTSCAWSPESSSNWTQTSS